MSNRIALQVFEWARTSLYLPIQHPRAQEGQSDPSGYVTVNSTCQDSLPELEGISDTGFHQSTQAEDEGREGTVLVRPWGIESGHEALFDARD